MSVARTARGAGCLALASIAIVLTNGCARRNAVRVDKGIPADARAERPLGTQAYRDLLRRTQGRTVDRSVEDRELRPMIDAIACGGEPCSGADSASNADVAWQIFRDIRGVPLNEYEPNVFRQFVRNLERGLEGGLRSRAQPLPDGITSGAVLSPCFNAVTIPLQDVWWRRALGIARPEERLIVINLGLDVLFGELAKLGVLGLPISLEQDMVAIDLDSAAIARKVEQTPGIDSLFRMLVLSYLLAGPAGGGPSIKADSLRLPLIAGTLTAAEFFVLGHEYGHALLKHRPSGLVQIPAGRGVFTAPTPVSREASMELAADSVGVDLMVAALRVDQPEELVALRAQGVSMFFSWLDILDRATIVVTRDSQPWGGYPRASDRREAVRLAMHRLNVSRSDERALGDGYDLLLRLLWQRSAGWLEQRRDGIVAAMRVDSTASRCFAGSLR